MLSPSRPDLPVCILASFDPGSNGKYETYVDRGITFRRSDTRIQRGEESAMRAALLASSPHLLNSARILEMLGHTQSKEQASLRTTSGNSDAFSCTA